MSAREELINLMGLNKQKDYSKAQLEIEFKTELAHIDAYREWVVKLHDMMLAENEHEEIEQEKKELDAAAVAEHLSAAAESRTIEDLGLSNRATLAFKKLGIEKLTDLVNFRKSDIEKIPVLGVKNATLMERQLSDYGLSFLPEEAKTEEPAAEEIPVPETKVETAPVKTDVQETETAPVVEEKIEPVVETPTPAVEETPVVETIVEEKNEPIVEAPVVETPTPETKVETAPVVDDDDDDILDTNDAPYIKIDESNDEDVYLGNEEIIDMDDDDDDDIIDSNDDSDDDLDSYF